MHTHKTLAAGRGTIHDASASASLGNLASPPSFSGVGTFRLVRRIRYIIVNQPDYVNPAETSSSSTCQPVCRQETIHRMTRLEVPTETLKSIKAVLAGERNRITSVVARLFSMGRQRTYDSRELYEQAIRVRLTARQLMDTARLMRDVALSGQGDKPHTAESANEGATIDITDRLGPALDYAREVRERATG